MEDSRPPVSGDFKATDEVTSQVLPAQALPVSLSGEVLTFGHGPNLLCRPTEEVRDLGNDRNYSEVSIERCAVCGQHWLLFRHQEEAFTGSGLWYRLPLSESEAQDVTKEDARLRFERAFWYWAGGSYFDSAGFRRSGKLIIAPYIGIR